jgi:hypothetical protein
MDARSVAEAAGIGVGTLNVWIQRGSIPGMTTGSRGRLRDFDLDAATKVGLIAALVRLGLDAPVASQAATEVRGRHKRVLVIPHPAKSINLQENRTMAVMPFETEAEIPDLLRKFGGAPPAYLVVNLELIAGVMRRASDAWERARRGR